MRPNYTIARDPQPGHWVIFGANYISMPLTLEKLRRQVKLARMIGWRRENRDRFRPMPRRVSANLEV